jgi:hypothetical protein
LVLLTMASEASAADFLEGLVFASLLRCRLALSPSAFPTAYARDAAVAENGLSVGVGDERASRLREVAAITEAFPAAMSEFRDGLAASEWRTEILHIDSRERISLPDVAK